MAFTITEQPEPSLGGMKNLLITLTPLSSYLVQNVLIGQTQYLPGTVYLPGVVHYTVHACEHNGHLSSLHHQDGINYPNQADQHDETASGAKQQGEKRTMNNMTFSMTAKQINMMECCAPIEYHTLQGQHPHQKNTERPDASLGGMKNLLITSTLRSCYPVQNMVIDQTQYMLYSLLTPSLPSPDMKNTRITARVEFSIKNRRHEEGFKDNANMTSVNVFMAFPIQLTQLEWHENWKGDTELNHSDRRY